MTRDCMNDRMPNTGESFRTRKAPLRILFVCNDAAEVKRCLREFAVARIRVAPEVVTAPDTFVKCLNSKCLDAVLVQYPTPRWRGTQPMEILRLRDAQIPLIFLTRALHLEQAASLISRGAADCIDRDHIGHLPVAIRRAVKDNQLRIERDESERRLRHSEARYRALAGNLTYGICRCSGTGNFLEVNQALVTMLGYSSRKQLLSSRYVNGIFRDPEKRTHLLGVSGRDHAKFPFEVVWKRKDRAPLTVRLSGREVGNEGDAKTSYEIIVEDVTQQRKLEDHLRHQAAKDPLTGLANYRQLVEILDTEIKRSQRTERAFALLLLDLDGLKAINDRFGHVIGSKALCRLADVLGNSGRDIDTAARFGGDEFALVLPETGEKAALSVARRICENLAHDQKRPKLSVSVGTATYPSDGKTVETLLSAADVALYRMKTRRGLDFKFMKPSIAQVRSIANVERARPMKEQPFVTSDVSAPASRLQATLTHEESIVLRALLSGRSVKHICKELRISSSIFDRLMRDLREKTDSATSIALLAWAKARPENEGKRSRMPERNRNMRLTSRVNA